MKSGSRILLLLFTINFAQTICDAFPAGTERSYSFQNDVQLSDYKGGKDVAYRLSATIRVGSIWTHDDYNLLRLQLISPKINVPNHSKSPHSKLDYTQHSSNWDNYRSTDFYALWHMGTIKHVYLSKNENEAVGNLKKSIISLFQYQLLDGQYVETDVAGECVVNYASLTPDLYEKRFIDCKSSDLHYHSRSDKAIGVDVRTDRTAEFKVTENGLLDKIESRERHHVSIVANKNVGNTIESIISLRFDGSVSKVSVISAESIEDAEETIGDYERVPIESSVDASCKECAPVKAVVKALKDDLTTEKLGTFKAAMALINMVPAARKATKEELLQILNARTFQDVRGQLLDVLAATQTTASHNAVLDILNFKSEKDMAMVERYLQALAIGSRSQKSVMEQLLTLSSEEFENPKTEDTLTQTLASMAYRYARQSTNNYDSEIVQQITSHLKESLVACKNDDITCCTKYIRGLHNLLSPQTVDILMEKVYSADRRISAAAMKALAKYPNDVWTSELKLKLQDIFYQKTGRFDSSARTLALDVLMKLKPTQLELEYFLNYLRSNDNAFEVKQYLLQTIRLIADQCPRFQQKIQSLIKSNKMLNNYHILAQKGLTTALSRQFSDTPSFNGTLVSVQEIHNGVLKRGVVDMFVNGQNNDFSIFTLGLYAEGLSSFVGGSTDESDGEETVTAGMEITVQGSYFRPLEFFNGQGELMGHVFSGTGSEPTTAYHATTLLHDHEQTIRLLNGATFTVNVLGGLSIDLNGQVQFSLWNRNAHSQVDKSAGLALIGSLNLNSGFTSLTSTFTVNQEPKLNLVSDIDFSSDVLFCMQLSQPQTVLRHHIVKTEEIIDTKHRIKHKTNVEYRLPGYTHGLNKKNNDMCGTIFENK